MIRGPRWWWLPLALVACAEGPPAVEEPLVMTGALAQEPTTVLTGTVAFSDFEIVLDEQLYEVFSTCDGQGVQVIAAAGDDVQTVAVTLEIDFARATARSFVEGWRDGQEAGPLELSVDEIIMDRLGCDWSMLSFGAQQDETGISGVVVAP